MTENPRRLRQVMAWLVPLLGAVLVAGCGDASSHDEPDRDDTHDTRSPGDATPAPDTTGDDVAQTDGSAPEDTAPAGLGPPYPIVLAHGMAGFEHLANLEFVPYWYRIPEHLEALGETVHVTEVDPLNTSDVRGSQLLGQIELLLSQTGHEKVILVGHSQGGLDARWVAHHRPERVAAVLTIATPHGGSPVCDVVLGIVPDDRIHDLADALVNFFGQAFYDELGNESSLMAPTRLFTSEGIAEFNARITDQPGVAYYSVTGRSDKAASDEHCFVPDSPEFVDKYWEVVDPIAPELWFSESVVSSLSGEPSDGLVPVSSGKWGRFLGCIPADHMDEVGQLLGDRPGTGNSFDHLEFFAGLVTFLRAEGH